MPREPKKIHVIQTRLDDESLLMLEKIAKNDGITKSYLIRLLIQVCLVIGVDEITTIYINSTKEKQ